MDDYEEEAQDEQAQKAISDVERSANASEETAKNTKDLKDGINEIKDAISKKGKGGGTDSVRIEKTHDQKEAEEKTQNNVAETANNTARSVEAQEKTNENLNDLKQSLTNFLQTEQERNEKLQETIEQGKQNQQKAQAKTEAKQSQQQQAKAKPKTAPKSEEKEETKTSKPKTGRKKSTPKQEEEEESTPKSNAKTGPKRNSSKKQEKTEETREQKDSKWSEAREHFEKAYGNKKSPAGDELGLTKRQQRIIKNAVKHQHDLAFDLRKNIEYQMRGLGDLSHFTDFKVAGIKVRDFNPDKYLRSYSGDARSKVSRHYKVKTLKPIPARVNDEVRKAHKLSGPLRVTSPLSQKEIDDINAHKKAAQENKEARKKREQKEHADKRAIERLAEHPVDEKTLEERNKENQSISRTRQDLLDKIEKQRLADLKSKIPAQDVLEANARKEADEQWGLDDVTEEQRKKYKEIGEIKQANEKKLKKWNRNRREAEKKLQDEYEKQHPRPTIDGIIHDDNIVSPEDFKKFAEERLSPYRIEHITNQKGDTIGTRKVRNDRKPTVTEIESLHYKNGVIPEEELALKPKEWWDKTYTGSAEQRNIGRKTREQMDELANLNKAAETERYKKDEDKFINNGLAKWEDVHKKPETNIIQIALELGLDAPELLRLKKVEAEAKNGENQKVETEVHTKEETAKPESKTENNEGASSDTYLKDDRGKQNTSTHTVNDLNEEEKKAKKENAKSRIKKTQSQTAWNVSRTNENQALAERHNLHAQNVRDENAQTEARKKFEANMTYFTKGHRGMGGAYHDELMRGLLYRGFRFIDWRGGLLRTTAGRIVGDTTNDILLRKMLGYKKKTIQVPKMVPEVDDKGQIVKDAEGKVKMVPQMVQARDKRGRPIFNEDGTPKMEKVMQTELISNGKPTKGQQRLRKLLGWHPQEDPLTHNDIVPSDAGISASLMMDRAMFAGAIRKVGMVALPVLLATAAAGATTAEIRDVRNRTINNGTTAGQAFGNTAQDALFDVAHLFGFSANTGKDIREDRQEALQQNYKLFGQKADNLVSTDMWARSMGFTTQQDTNWIEEQVAMGKSAEQVRNSFLNLTKIANSTGVSFKNLSEAVATEETNATKLLGSKYTGGLVKGTAGALEDLKKAGLNGTQQTLNDLAGDKQFQLALTRELNAKGYAKQASELAATPSLLMQFALSHGVFKGALSNFSQMYYNAAGGQQLAYEAMLVKTGLKASDVQSSLQTMYNQTKKNANATGNSSSSSNSSSKKKTAPQPQVLEIRLQPGTVGKVLAGGKYMQGLHDVTGTGQYFSMKNFTTGNENE